MQVKSWWQSRTIIIGALEIIAGVASFLIELPPETTLTALIAGVLTIILRIVTKIPVGK